MLILFICRCVRLPSRDVLDEELETCHSPQLINILGSHLEHRAGHVLLIRHFPTFGTFHGQTFHRQDILETGHFIDRNISEIGHFIVRTFHSQDISQLGHFINRTFYRQDISQIGTFHRQDISQLGHFIVRTFHRQDILQTGHFIDRTFIVRTFQ